MNTCLYANDIDDYACKVYCKNWNDGTMHQEDIRNVTAGDVCRRGIPDVVCGGFPCQDISVAGKGAGIAEGTRSGLWFEMFRLVCEIRPKYVVVENVAAILNRGIDIVLGDLSTVGYDAEWQVLPAVAFGAPHRRERIFLVAYSADSNGKHERAKSNMQGCEQQDSGAQSVWTETRHGFGNLCEVVSDSNRSRCLNGCNSEQKHEDIMAQVGQTSEDKQQRSKREYRTSTVCEIATNSNGSGCKEQWRNLSVFTPQHSIERCGWWTVEPEVGRVANGISNRVDRLKCLGNAIVPQVTEYVGRCIMEHHGSEFTFAELFAGIGGFRLGFEWASGREKAISQEEIN